MMKSVRDLTRDLFNCPTAPFREIWVLNHIKSELERLKVPYFCDRFGNVVAGVSSQKLLKARPRLALMAHTDHPGFHLIKKMGTLWKARWHGGGPGHSMRGALVAIHHPSYPGAYLRGVIKRSQGLGSDKRGCDWIWIQPQKPHTLAQQKIFENLGPDCFGAFDFPGFKQRGNRIFTRAADDLAGCATILSTFESLPKKERGHLVGIFTRAEEVGFRGALALLYHNVIPPNVLTISLEASRTLPGARLGKGPVIRLGDRRTLFDSEIISLIDDASRRLKKQDRHFSTQRRIMDGGTCEATPFNLYGRRCAGLAVPLGNYHNQGVGKPGPEYIDLRDLQANVALCSEVVKVFAKNSAPFKNFDRDLRRGFKSHLPLFKNPVFTARRGAF